MWISSLLEGLEGQVNLVSKALLLGLVTFLGLVGMTMGGLGTLFAVFVSPVLRSLNRYTVFVYGASVLLLASLLDASLRRRLS